MSVIVALKTHLNITVRASTRYENTTVNNGIAQSNDIEIYSVPNWNQPNAFNVPKYVCILCLAVVARCFGSSIKLGLRSHRHIQRTGQVSELLIYTPCTNRPNGIEWIASDRKRVRDKTTKEKKRKH